MHLYSSPQNRSTVFARPAPSRPVPPCTATRARPFIPENPEPANMARFKRKRNEISPLSGQNERHRCINTSRQRGDGTSRRFPARLTGAFVRRRSLSPAALRRGFAYAPAEKSRHDIPTARCPPVTSLNHLVRWVLPTAPLHANIGSKA